MRMWHMTHSYVRHDSCIFATWFIHMCDMTHAYVRHDSFIRVTWLIHMCDMTHSCVTWLIHMCDMTHSYVWYDSFICVKWPTWLGRSHPRPWLGPRDTQDWYWEGVKARFVCILAVYILYMCLPPAPIIGATRHPRRYWEGVNARCVKYFGCVYTPCVYMGVGGRAHSWGRATLKIGIGKLSMLGVYIF